MYNCFVFIRPVKIGELKHRSDKGFLSNMADGFECWLGFNFNALPGRTLVFGQICPTLYDCRCHETKEILRYSRCRLDLEIRGSS